MATSANQPKEFNGHQEIGHKSLLKSDALYQYILETSVYPREHASMKELRELTAKHPMNLQSTSVDEAHFINMLIKLINAKKTMEIGVFTGYSLLATALALPHDGKILAIDINRDDYEIGLPILKKAGVAHKVEFKEGPALPILDLMNEDIYYDTLRCHNTPIVTDRALPDQVEHHGTFDFIFVDADKNNYLNYHERVMKLIKVGGVIGYDNTLWNGSMVAPPDARFPDYIIHSREFVIEFNKALAADRRVEISQLSVGDGITLCRRVS